MLPFAIVFIFYAWLHSLNKPLIENVIDLNFRHLLVSFFGIYVTVYVAVFLKRSNIKWKSVLLSLLSLIFVYLFWGIFQFTLDVYDLSFGHYHTAKLTVTALDSKKVDFYLSRKNRSYTEYLIFTGEGKQFIVSDDVWNVVEKNKTYSFIIAKYTNVIVGIDSAADDKKLIKKYLIYEAGDEGRIKQLATQFQAKILKSYSSFNMMLVELTGESFRKLKNSHNAPIVFNEEEGNKLVKGIEELNNFKVQK